MKHSLEYIKEKYKLDDAVEIIYGQCGTITIGELWCKSMCKKYETCTEDRKNWYKEIVYTNKDGKQSRLHIDHFSQCPKEEHTEEYYKFIQRWKRIYDKRI